MPSQPSDSLNCHRYAPSSVADLCSLPEAARPSSRFTMAVNASFVSPTADAKLAHAAGQLDYNGIVTTVLNNVNGWSIALTCLLIAVAYDQCTFPFIACAD